MRHYSRRLLEIEPEIIHPKASTTTSLAFHVIMEKTELNTPKARDDFVHKRYVRLLPYYLSRSLKKKSVVSNYLKNLVLFHIITLFDFI